MIVTTYRNAYVVGTTTLCAACAAEGSVLAQLPVLGEVEHGAHEGSCDAHPVWVTAGDVGPARATVTGVYRSADAAHEAKDPSEVVLARRDDVHVGKRIHLRSGHAVSAVRW